MRNASVKAARVFQFVFLLVFLALCGVIGRELYETKQTETISISLVTTYETNEDADWSHGMLDMNEDYAGWLEVDGTSIRMPIVLGTDNEYYLRHDFSCQDNNRGCCFLDFRTELSPHGNLLIYGHNMKDDTMFGELDQFKDGDFFEQHRLVKWSGRDGEHLYQLFAAAVIPGSVEDSDYVEISQWINRPSQKATAAMLDTLEKRSAIWEEMQWEDSDRYLFLVTCDYSRTNGRLVLAAQEVVDEAS